MSLSLVTMAKIASDSTHSETPTKTKMDLRPRSRITTKRRPKVGAAKKKTSKLEANKPKKPPTAFFYYLEDFRKGFQEEHPDVKSMREVGKACGEKWKIMTYEEKIQYYDIATKKRAEFEKAMKDYVKKQENGEFDESDEDSEYNE
uniref:high mobility group B protein 14 n=1 Tax=Erigeron canadensis TaxID=72917 RepID=UPI001CB8C982|nr:high mobility group B protein 14 [Erigeron canadensis]